MQTFTYPSSSNPREKHTVTVRDDGTVICSCRGFRTPNKCWHYRKHALCEEPKAKAAQPDLIDVGRPSVAAAAIGGYVQPMLAQPMPTGSTIDTFAKMVSRKDPLTSWWAEEKYDGHRITLAVSKDAQVAAWSRPRAGSTMGLPRTLPPHLVGILDQFPAGTYDGELLAPHSAHRPGSAGVADLAMSKRLRFVLFDMLRDYNGEDLTQLPLHERRHRLDLLGAVLERAQIEDVFVAPIFKITRPNIERIWQRHGEGAILKRADAPYQPGVRSNDWIKVKQTYSATLTLTGFEKGSLGKCAVCVLVGTVNGVDVETTVKTLDDAHRAMFEKAPRSFIGRKVRIEHQGIFGNKLRHPMFDHLEA